MSIRFDAERWERIKRDSERWWRGDLGRPLIQVRVGGYEPDRPAPRVRLGGRGALYDFGVAPEDVVDQWDYGLSQTRFLGDAFPVAWPDLGPGVGAVFAGAVAEPAPDTVWFHPPRPMELRDVRLRYDRTHPLARRVKEFYEAGARRWGRTVQMGMTDLGGNMDLVSTFRPSESLLMDLYDAPEEVERLMGEAHALWWDAFTDLDAAARKVSPGYTAWASIYSSTPYYMLQCDFCYMIGPEMFDRFVRPELAASCRRLDRAFYHLDGIGQLPHLDSLLSIPELKGVQWVPGAGQKPEREWPQVYERIHKAGKKIQVYDMKALDVIAQRLGTAEDVVLLAWVPRDREAEARDLLRRYGVPE